MCGRYSLIADKSTIIAEFALQSMQVLTPRYNIAPSTIIPVILHFGQLEFASWGFKPGWAISRVDFKPFINARIEDITNKGTFKQAIANNRCLILADGYYEWKLIKRTKQPFYITLYKHKIFAFAGIFDKQTNTCAILTKAAEAEISKVHNRMPVILSSQEEYKNWLDKNSKLDYLLEALITNTHKHYQIEAVSTMVNNVKNDHIGCIQGLQ